MEKINPYEASQTVATPDASQQVGGAQSGVPVTPSALAAIIRTKSWVRLVGIVMILHIVLSLVDIGLSGGGELSGPMGPGALIGMLIGGGILILFVILAARLLQYAGHIKRLSQSNDSVDLERAVEAQTKFWVMSGIMLVLFLALMLISLLVALIGF